MKADINTDIKEIKKHLKINESIIIERVNETGSTNEDMKKRARLGEKEISVLIANSQTKGKGSKGRSFFSPENTGIYMSFLLRPTLESCETTLLTTMAAVALSEAIEELTNLKTDIKWVNDIYIGGKKVAGILTEGAYKGKDKIDFVILGLGVNLVVPDGGFPREISMSAGALGVGEIKERLIGEIINRFVYYYRRLPDKGYMAQYKKRLFFLSKEVTVTKNDRTFVAKAVDVDSMCRLIVELPDGERVTLDSGEIGVG